MKCIKCNLDKELIKDNFYWRNDSKRWSSTCKSCILLKMKQKYLEEADKIKEKAAIYRKINRNIINDKQIIYNSRKDIKEKKAKWRQANKEILRKKEKEWILKNPEKYKEIVRRKSKKQRQKSSYKLKVHVSRQVNFALHRSGNSKRGESVIKFLPYTIDELKKYLETLFESWMSWGNYGLYKSNKWNDNDQSTWTWQIDHIIPQSDLPYSSMNDENFKKCWALENLRPYSAKQNIIDGSNRIRHNI